MSHEERLLHKLQHLSEHEREQLLHQIDEWIAQHLKDQFAEVQQAVTAVQSTWASISLDLDTLRWVAEDEELEYEVERSS